MRTENRLIVENLSSRVSWQVSIVHFFNLFFFFFLTIIYLNEMSNRIISILNSAFVSVQ